MRQLDLFPDAVHLERTDRARNMQRYYSLEVAPDLFGGHALVRAWGRIGRSTTIRIERHGSEAEALAALLEWTGRKRRKGYR